MPTGATAERRDRSVDGFGSPANDLDHERLVGRCAARGIEIADVCTDPFGQPGHVTFWNLQSAERFLALMRNEVHGADEPADGQIHTLPSSAWDGFASGDPTEGHPLRLATIVLLDDRQRFRLMLWLSADDATGPSRDDS